MRHRSVSSSPAWLPGFQPPDPLQADGWRLTPLGPELAEQDHAAWRSCRARLVEELAWGGWPAEDFSLADNVADLAEHYGEFERREAYAYSLMAPDKCIGCVYIEPWTDGARLAWWVIDQAIPIEGEIVAAVVDWLAIWPFDRVVLPVRPGNQRGRTLLEGLGLEPVPGPEDHVSYAA